jgi:hypothetical protein
MVCSVVVRYWLVLVENEFKSDVAMKSFAIPKSPTLMMAIAIMTSRIEKPF